MKSVNLSYAAIATVAVILSSLIILKIVSDEGNPEAASIPTAPAPDNNAVANEQSGKAAPRSVADTQENDSIAARDEKIRRLIDELVNLNSKHQKISQTEGVISDLCSMGNAVIPSIRKILASDASANVKSPAARVLAQLSTAESVETLATCINSESDPVCKDYFIRSLQAVGKADASPSLIKALGASKDIYFTAEVKQAIARTGTPETVRQLVDACHEQAETSPQTANLLSALSVIRHPETVPILLEVASADQNAQVRRSALQALSSIGDPNAARALVDLLESKQGQDSKPLLIDAISKINNKASLDYLRGICENKQNPEDLRQAASRAIFTIRNGVQPAE